MRMPPFTRAACALFLAAASLNARRMTAQQTIGSVPTADAAVSGWLEVSGGRAVLVGSSSITARDHTAEITLARGGAVRICQTSAVKLSPGAAASGTAPLLLALDRGALEVRMQASAGDAILTPDLRFAIRGLGSLDLRLRVTGSGDTCVEQRSPTAPALVITDNFGDTTYEVRAGQHVLFEHGSLREVVDHETSPCGCPEPEPTISIAEAALRPPSKKKSPAEAAAAQHPFPTAQSAGLAPGADIPQAAPGIVHTQVAATLGYEGSATGTPAQATAPAPLVPAPPTPVPSPSRAEEPHGFRHSVGRFFRTLFGAGS